MQLPTNEYGRKKETYEGNLFVDKRLYDFFDVSRRRRPDDRPKRDLK
jgi:hypothetical protein